MDRTDGSWFLFFLLRTPCPLCSLPKAPAPQDVGVANLTFSFNYNLPRILRVPRFNLVLSFNSVLRVPRSDFPGPLEVGSSRTP